MRRAALVLATACLFVAPGPRAGLSSRRRPPPLPEAPAPRVPELLRLDCASTLGRREVTLFGNGTVRLRRRRRPARSCGARASWGRTSWTPSSRRLALGGPLRGAAPARRGSKASGSSAASWSSRCPASRPAASDFGRYDTLPLALSRAPADRRRPDDRPRRAASRPSCRPATGRSAATCCGGRTASSTASPASPSTTRAWSCRASTSRSPSTCCARSCGASSWSPRARQQPAAAAVKGGRPVLRISGGALRGRGLAVPPGARPTEGRVREALFSIWGDRLRRRALPRPLRRQRRGRASRPRAAARARVLCLEDDARAVRTLRANVEELGGEEGRIAAWRVPLPRGLSRAGGAGGAALRPDLRRPALRLHRLRGAAAAPGAAAGGGRRSGGRALRARAAGRGGRRA